MDHEQRIEADERREEEFRRHKYSFALAILCTWFGLMTLNFGARAGAVVVGAGGVLSIASGVYAARARRHMFGLSSRTSNSFVFVTASEPGSPSVWFIAGLLAVSGAVLLWLAVWSLTHAV